MTFASRAAAAAFASLFLIGTAFAQAPAPAPAPAAPAATAPAATPNAKAKPERTAISKECSAQADAKGLKGKDRKKFRSECKRNGGKAS